jgi:hypothetical protein
LAPSPATTNALLTSIAQPPSTLNFVILHDSSLSTTCSCLPTTLKTHLLQRSLWAKWCDTRSCILMLQFWGVCYMAYFFTKRLIFFLGATFPIYPAHFFVQHLSDDISHRGDMNEILQCTFYIIKCFLEMDDSGQ